MRKTVILGALLLLLASCALKTAVRPPEAGPQIELISCRLAAGRDLVGVQFLIRNVANYDPPPANIYLVDKSTGEKFYTVRLQRIGQIPGVAEPGRGPVRVIIFKNREGKLKPGSRVTLVIGQAQLDQVVVGE